MGVEVRNLKGEEGDSTQESLSAHGGGEDVTTEGKRVVVGLEAVTWGRKAQKPVFTRVRGRGGRDSPVIGSLFEMRRGEGSV